MRLIITFIFLLFTSYTLGAQPPIVAQDLISNNILVNPGFENGKYGWTASGGATATANATAVGAGTYGYDWDSNSSSQTLLSSSITIPNGLKAKQGVAFCKIKSASGIPTHTITVNDGTNDLVSAQTITASTSEFTRNAIYFQFPTSGTVRIKFTSVAANEAEIYIDECFLGDAFDVINISQAKARVHARRLTSSQAISSTNFTTLIYNDEASTNLFDRFSEFNTTTGVFTAKEAVDLVVSCRGAFSSYTSTEILSIAVYKNAATYPCSSSNTMTGTDVHAQVNCIVAVAVGDTIECQASSVADASYNFAASTSSGISISSLPTDSSQAVRIDTIDWRVDANISGANPSLGTIDVATYTGIENGSLTLTNNTGRGAIAAQIPCSSTNAPSGTTCSAGSESVGVSFVLPAAGDVLACATASWFMSAAGAITGALQIVETPNSAQTISQEGKSRAAVDMDSAIVAFPFRVCGTFTFASAGQKTLRLFYEQDVTGTISSSLILADAGAAAGQRDIHWEVYPINQSMPAPILIGSVTSNATGTERIERAEINCDAASSITQQSGSWISSIGNRSTTACAIVLTSGMFSAAPVCSFSLKAASALATSVRATSTTSVIVYSETSADFDGYLVCMGAK